MAKTYVALSDIVDTTALSVDETTDIVTLAGDARFSQTFRQDDTGYPTTGWYDKTRLNIRKIYNSTRPIGFLAANIGAHVQGQGASGFTERLSGVVATVKDTTSVTDKSVTGATNATPIVITATAHGYSSGEALLVYNVGGNTAANGVRYITVLDVNTFQLYSDIGRTTAVAGSGAYTSGGTVSNRPIMYAVDVSVNPTVRRGDLPSPIANQDDVNGVVVHNTGTARATDAYYLGRNEALSQPRITITNAVNNGSGLIRITATGHGLSTGDSVAVYSVGGVTASVGKWTVTVIDANTVDLQGSAFSGTYTGGGRLHPLTDVEWITQFTLVPASDYGIRLVGDYREYALDFKDGGYGSGMIRLKNSAPVMFRNYSDTADFELFRVNTASEFQVSQALRLNNQMIMANGANMQVAVTNGTKIGTDALQKLGFWNATPVVRPTGWGAATGTATRTTYATGTATVTQLAERLKALIDDLTTIGVIGA